MLVRFGNSNRYNQLKTLIIKIHNFIMRLLCLLIFFILPNCLIGQHVIIEEGVGVGPIKLGLSFEEVVKILGFDGDLKTYDDYLAEELFNEDPEIALECAIGFDYYIKYEHLLTLPISYVFFKDSLLNQIRVSSFPEYYFSIAKDTKTKYGLNFWDEDKSVVDIYGVPALEVNYENFILNSYFYFEQGITVNLREKNYRSAHIYQKLDTPTIEAFSKVF